MPRPADEPKTNTLPNPELNPLLNPLLAANMGRWAEVYFTSPPEKREEAVAGLIRELGGHSPESAARPIQFRPIEVPPVEGEPVEVATGEDSSEPGVNSIETEIEKETEAGGFPAENSTEENYYVTEAVQVCAACGHINSAEQNFCGMCGTSLRNVNEAEIIQVTETPLPDSESRWQDVGPSPALDRDPLEHASHASADSAAEKEIRAQEFLSFDPEVAQTQVRGEETGYEKVEPAEVERGEVEHDEFEHDEFERPAEARDFDDLPQFAREAEPVPYRYRLYVGTVFAVLLTLLVYMGWRGTKYISGTSGQQSPAARVIPPALEVAEQPHVNNAPAEKVPAGNSPTADAPVSKGRAENIPATPVPSRKIAKATKPKPVPARKGTVESKPAARIVTKAGNAAAIASASTGTEELATAENYLNGAQGRGRDAREAAQWLWKSVSKGNAAATMVLSDLYLRGDGVPKSCDQARLLLNAAARKGSASAADRLRNLQTFGCQ